MAEQIRKNPNKWVERGIDMIKRNASQLLKLIDQMLDLQKLEAKKLKPEYVCGDILPYLKYLIEPYFQLVKNKKIKFSEMYEDAEMVMDYDAEKIKTIVTNLLSNAIKYTDEGKIEFQCKKTASDGKEIFVIRVEDSGKGIEAQNVSKIFTRFYQADDTSTRKEGGVGIGLSLTKELVELCGGTIEVESTAGQGTIFTIQLPITKKALPRPVSDELPALSDIHMVKKKKEVGPFSSFGKDLPSILIIEDSPDVITYLKICLENFQIITASNGEEGEKIGKAQIPDLIILDMMMPEKDGFEVCQILKNDVRTSHIPIIMLTAKADFESKLYGYSQGADAYLTKPFNEEQLLVRIENLLTNRRKLQERYNDFPLPFTEDEFILREDDFILKVKSTIETNLSDETFGIEALCRTIGISRTQLHHKVKALTNSSASIFIRNIRLQHARQLLVSSELPVSEIAYQVGFKDPNYFSRLYREKYKIPPREDRRR
jgi:DNA-binding response OmpR family regulator/two-component sensor histidine kinase